MKYLTLIIAILFCSYLTGAERKERPEKPSISKPAPKKFPLHWGAPPRIQTRDMVKLPAKFGQGSSTLAKWISDNLKRDSKKERPEGEKPKPPVKPAPPIVPLPPVEIKNKIDSYKKVQKVMQDGLKEKIGKLGKKPSREDVRKAVEEYKKDNEQLIESQKELGESINKWQKENRPERSKKPELPQEIKDQAQKVRETKKSLDEVRQSFGQALKRSKDLTKEERADLVKEFKEANVEKHKALKEAQKELQKQIREIKQQGDRRQ